MFVMYLNDMRRAHVEDVQAAVRGSSVEAIHRFVDSERVEPYTEPGTNCYGEVTWHKSFRKGGPLEWFNPPDSFTKVVDIDEVVRGYLATIEAETVDADTLAPHLCLESEGYGASVQEG